MSKCINRRRFLRNSISVSAGAGLDHNKYHDNIWVHDIQETVSFMQTVSKPWIAYKVLAAGAVHPSQAFPFAFANGADFICVGMFDFQITEDANIVREALAGNLKRTRPWCA